MPRHAKARAGVTDAYYTIKTPACQPFGEILRNVCGQAYVGLRRFIRGVSLREADPLNMADEKKGKKFQKAVDKSLKKWYHNAVRKRLQNSVRERRRHE